MQDVSPSGLALCFTVMSPVLAVLLDNLSRLCGIGIDISRQAPGGMPSIRQWREMSIQPQVASAILC